MLTHFAKTIKFKIPAEMTNLVLLEVCSKIKLDLSVKDQFQLLSVEHDTIFFTSRILCVIKTLT